MFKTRTMRAEVAAAMTTTTTTAAICLFVLTVTTQWTRAMSSSVASDPISSLSSTTPLIQTKTKEINDFIDDISRSDEILSFLNSNDVQTDDYTDDLDADINVVKERESQNTDWDVLIFTQEWPVTTCYHWREENASHTCNLPSKSEFWTIHGIWPTKLGHMSPAFCNKTAEFDLDKLEIIMDRLEQFWPEIYGDVKIDYLWKHEWLKHGTCAALIQELNDELKYFQQGIVWREKYLISDILGSSGIHPDSNNTVIALHTALVKGLGKNPSIHCIYDNKKDISLLVEIRVCFNKQLELVDCDGVKLGDAVSIDYPGGTVITNCHVSKPVHYPSHVPPVLRKKTDNWKFPIVNVYKLLQFIMWFTL